MPSDASKSSAKPKKRPKVRGLRYRFNDGIAARGRFVGKSIPVVDSTPKKVTIEPESVINREDEGEDEDIINDTAADAHQVKDITHQRCLSNNIAELIAVINLGFNGYRDLVLPRAEIDPMVRKAIVLIVEQHLSLQNGTTVCLDPTAYSSLVRDLITRSTKCAPQNDETALTVLLLLHIREMISGSDNFKLIYGSLRVVVNALTQNVDGVSSIMQRFLQMQILRVCLFGEPLFNEANGAHFIQAQRQACLEFIRWCIELHPELEGLLLQLLNLMTWACDIYVQRAICNPPAAETVPMVERFKQSLEDVDAYVDIVGRHLLVWPYFIVAAESSTADHRHFFLEKLASLYNTTGCWNILRAIDQVKEIWASQSSIRWTSLLGGPKQALIM
ncbi:Acriflavine sensitivity control acr-2 [Fusarium albosuccineum]|uniref:Acriflavine sensitivity control acr-2 n=1 Tax=Fusarium albosuccineum TaxID=1237068 RepID=A0A8H4KZ80_9HYPO|nr:Acriflavine sensitivity control acr-2 [Fusarium albosuccineum]